MASTLSASPELCAWNLARAHAHGGDRAANAAYLGKNETFEREDGALAVRRGV